MNSDLCESGSTRAGVRERIGKNAVLPVERGTSKAALRSHKQSRALQRGMSRHPAAQVTWLGVLLVERGMSTRPAGKRPRRR